MRRRFALLWALVILAAALTAPATTAAANVQSSGYTYTIKSDRCTGPTYQKIYFKVKETAAGSTSANGLTIDSWAQEFYSGAWHTTYVWNQQHYTFPANGAGHYLTGWRSFGDPPYSVRIVMQLRVWKDNTVLAHKTLTSGVC
jgi:hypothetical protein